MTGEFFQALGIADVTQEEADEMFKRNSQVNLASLPREEIEARIKDVRASLAKAKDVQPGQ